MASADLALQYSRQYAKNIDVDFEMTTEERQAYLSNPLRYAGQPIFDVTEGKPYYLSTGLNAWLPYGGGITGLTWSQVTEKPLTFAPSAHSHQFSEVTGLQSALDGKSGTGHSHSWNSITDKPESFPVSGHTHEIEDVNGLQTALDNASPIEAIIGVSNPEGLFFVLKEELDYQGNPIDDGSTPFNWNISSGQVEDISNPLFKPEYMGRIIYFFFSYYHLNTKLLGFPQRYEDLLNENGLVDFSKSHLYQELHKEKGNLLYVVDEQNSPDYTAGSKSISFSSKVKMIRVPEVYNPIYDDKDLYLFSTYGNFNTGEGEYDFDNGVTLTKVIYQDVYENGVLNIDLFPFYFTQYKSEFANLYYNTEEAVNQRLVRFKQSGFYTKDPNQYYLSVDGNDIKQYPLPIKYNPETKSYSTESNISTGEKSFALGYNTQASGDYSHAEGYSSEASGEASHAKGYYTQALGNYSHAEGYQTIASGNYSHAEGYKTIATGTYSHAEGYVTKAYGDGSVAVGNFSEAHGIASYAEGTQTRAYGQQSHSEGFHTHASGYSSHSQGNYTSAVGEASHTGGRGNSNTVRVLATGNAAFNHSRVTNASVSGASAANSAILGGLNHNIYSTATNGAVVAGSGHSLASGATNSAIIGGQNIVGTSPNTVYVPNLVVTGNLMNSTGGTIGGGAVGAHSHIISDVTGLQAALDGKSGTGHTHSWPEITNKPTTFTPSEHSHAISGVTGLQSALDGKAGTGHTHTWSQVTDKPQTFPATPHSHTWNDVTGKPVTFNPSEHAHQISGVTGLQSALDAATVFIKNEVVTNTPDLIYILEDTSLDDGSGVAVDIGLSTDIQGTLDTGESDYNPDYSTRELYINFLGTLVSGAKLGFSQQYSDLSQNGGFSLLNSLFYQELHSEVPHFLYVADILSPAYDTESTYFSFSSDLVYDRLPVEWNQTYLDRVVYTPYKGYFETGEDYGFDRMLAQDLYEDGVLNPLLHPMTSYAHIAGVDGFNCNMDLSGTERSLEFREPNYYPKNPYQHYLAVEDNTIVQIPLAIKFDKDLNSVWAGDNHAEGNFSTAFGSGSFASGDYSLSIGYGTVASGEKSFASGDNTQASGWYSHSEGAYTKAEGAFSHAEGSGTKALGTFSKSAGYNTEASGDASSASGKGNLFDFVKASGNVAFNHSEVSTSDVLGAAADNSAILGGKNNQLQPEALRSVVLGGQDINGTQADTVYVPNLVVMSGIIKDADGNPIGGGSPATTGTTSVSWNEITGKPTTFTPAAHSHTWSEITAKPTSFTPSSHSHTWNDVTGKPVTFNPSEHTHQISGITGLQSELDAKSGTGHTHSWSQITSKPTTFTPATHTHGEYIKTVNGLSPDASGNVVVAVSGGTGTPTSVDWSLITNKPQTFTPSEHTHLISEVENLQTELNSKSGTGHTHTWSQITGKPSTFAPAQHSHAVAEVTGLQSALDGKSGTGHTHSEYSLTSHTHSWSQVTDKPQTFPAAAHAHAWSEITNKPTTFTPSAHSHTLSEVTGLQSALDTKSGTGHTHSWSQVTDKPASFTPSTHSHSEYSLTSHTHTEMVKKVNGQAPDAQGNVNITVSATTSVSWESVSGKPSTFAPAAHSHTLSEVNGLQGALDGKANTGHTHNWENIQNKPLLYPASAHYHNISDIHGLQTALENVSSATGDVNATPNSIAKRTSDGSLNVVNLYATANVQSNSDARLKDNVTPYCEGLAKVMALTPVRYNRNDLGGKEEIGFIAQAVKEVEPLLVSYTNDTHSLDYPRINVLLVQAIQELKREVDELKKGRVG
ncbi:hypothetical protein EFA69_06535 [Rufibacter immobilis]|uniref:Peptidase S74 domain-containing protein n=1 Tax=Rufibacter immobilis TaxID=1348778 RepID=A0A3M9MZI2_9BACT|nr:tail fiber domain-containing protein [Rufibacter immobilis]RNI30944.1 hypothetical protein EFA69_06535 [Rufibacter immobilis]